MPMPPMPPPGGVPNANTDWWSDFYKAGPASVQMPKYDTMQQAQARREQQRVIQALQQQARGDLNSLAQQQLQQGYGQARAQQSSLGSTMRGQGAGAAMRGIQQGQAGIQRGFAGDQQMLMLQEQQAAQALLAQMLQQQQGQDIAQATGMAGTTNQANALNEAMKQFYAQMGSGLNIEQGQIGAERNAAQYGFDLATQELGNRLLNQGAQAAAGAAGTVAGMDWRSESQKKIDDAFYGR